MKPVDSLTGKTFHLGPWVCGDTAGDQPETTNYLSLPIGGAHVGWGEPIAGGTILSLFWSSCRGPYKKKPTTSHIHFLGNVGSVQWPSLHTKPSAPPRGGAARWVSEGQ